jgi:hypothetical protein
VIYAGLWTSKHHHRTDSTGVNASPPCRAPAPCRASPCAALVEADCSCGPPPGRIIARLPRRLAVGQRVTTLSVSLKTVAGQKIANSLPYFMGSGGPLFQKPPHSRRRIFSRLGVMKVVASSITKPHPSAPARSRDQFVGLEALVGGN